MNPLNSVAASLLIGAILAALASVGMQAGFAELGLAVWIHIVAGVMWLGLLYYFNVVHAPGLAEAAADAGGPGAAGITRYLTRRALAWFRWAAVLTWLTGLWYLARSGNLASAATLGHGGREHYGLVIGTGSWLGTIMLFNVWALIWPNQQRLLGLRPASDEQKARARRIAALASRVNLILSIPLLLCMGGANHALPF
jgi:uncharacterized membrane protein